MLNSWVSGSYVEAPPLDPAQPPSQAPSHPQSSLAAAHPVAARKASLNAIAQHQSQQQQQTESPHRRQTSADQLNGMPPPELRAHKRAQFESAMSSSPSLPLDLAELARPPPIHANEAMRSSSSLGHHSDSAAAAHRHTLFAPHGRAQSSDPMGQHPGQLPRAPSPERSMRDPTQGSVRTAKISGPTNAVPIGNANFKAQPPSSHHPSSTPPPSTSSLPAPPASMPSQSREAQSASSSSTSANAGGGRRDHDERRQRVKSSFWTFASRSNPDRGHPAQPVAQPSPVFGVPLADAVAVASVREGFMVPAVIFRCVEYLSEMGGTREDGIYRMSGSAAVVKGLKDRFNAGASGGSVSIVQR